MGQCLCGSVGHGSLPVTHCLLWSEAYEFQPVAVEVEATIFFISELGHEISEYSGDPLLFPAVKSACSFSDITPFSSMRPFPAEDEIDT